MEIWARWAFLMHIILEFRVTFFATEQASLIQTALSSTSLPEGVSIRTVDFENDLSAINSLPMDDLDTIVPVYGMVSEDCSDELTLIAVRNDQPIGQISVSFDISGDDFVEFDLFLTGIFVSSSERNNGIGAALGRAATDIVEAWRRSLAAAYDEGLEGGIRVSADVLPESGGSAIEKMMQNYADDLSNEVNEISSELA
jgi:GNAT superfamily N-acetyltransferase